MSTYYLVFSVYLLQLFGHLQSPVWTVVVNDYNLIVVATVEKTVGDMLETTVFAC